MSNNYNLTDDHIFTRESIELKLEKVIGRTLGEVDKNHVFNKTDDNPKITGIAGDVVEQSVLGYKQDSDQRPDILVDGVPVEVKTTGIRCSKKNGQKEKYEAKEPMSITAVSPKKIVNEEFEQSNFWHKVANMLLVFYVYASDFAVKSKDYANFYIKSYQFYQFNSEDKKRLKNDWEIVRNFIRSLQNFYSNPESQYPRISFELRNKLMYIDTAPKWPKSPRFRLKRSVVNCIVQDHFENQLEILPDNYDNFIDFDKKLHNIIIEYKGKTVEELIDIFKIDVKDINKLNKAIIEQIIVKMFGGLSSKINQIELFEKVGIIAKSLCISSKGERTEDTKLIPIDFEEIKNIELKFDQTFIYDYLMNHQFLCIVFEEKDKNQKFKENKFIGFKRFSINYEFINNDVKIVWNKIKDLVNNNKLIESNRIKKDGTLYINKTSVISTTINFPKSKDFVFFVRGDGKNSTKKTCEVNGIKMYKQYFWIRGDYMVKLLDNFDYI